MAVYVSSDAGSLQGGLPGTRGQKGPRTVRLVGRRAGPLGGNTQEPLQVQTIPGPKSIPEQQQGGLTPSIREPDAGAFLGLGCPRESPEGHMDPDSPWLGAGRAGQAPHRHP